MVGGITRQVPMSTPKLLLIDDDPLILNQMKWALAAHYTLYLAGERKKAIALFRRELPPLVTLDLGLPPYPREAAEGFRLLSEMLASAPHTKILVVSGNSERENALKAVDQGAYDFFTKPIDLDELLVTLRRAYQLFQLEAENRRLRAMPITDCGIIGNSSAINTLHRTIRKVAASVFPVLITGESGTGKELVARAIHQESARAAGPFVAINCGAIPENLMESELFGHEKGAFTGAHTQRKGRIEYAEGGTLFLDEIGELGLGLQVKILRFLQEKTLERVGGRTSRKVDARVIAATNRDLKAQAASGAFREDLYYRLSVVSINVPPLRERRGDLLLLSRAFMKRYADESGKRIKGITQEAAEAMAAYDWPGNIRELENKIKRAIVMADTPFLTLYDLELIDPAEAPPLPRLKDAKDKLERELVQAALTRAGGNITRAAGALGVSRQSFHDLLAKHRIERPG